MTSDEAVITVVGALNAIDVPYMVTGSLASNMYGISRSTKDADFVLESTQIDFVRFKEHLGPALQLDPQMSFETVTGTTRYIIRKSAGEPFTIELFFLSADTHDQSRFARRRAGELFGQSVWFPAPEDVIVTKLRWSKQGKRTKDVDDVRNVIAVQGDALDWDYIHRWCDEHGTRQLLQQIRDSIPEI